MPRVKCQRTVGFMERHLVQLMTFNQLKLLSLSKSIAVKFIATLNPRAIQIECNANRSIPFINIKSKIPDLPNLCGRI